jgi:peptide/nickel transport system substrate-binding protein
MTCKRNGKPHPYVPELKEQLLKGEIDRREFLRTVTLLGMSAGAAYSFANMFTETGPGLISSAAAATPKKGGVIRAAMQVQDMSDPAIYDWVEKSNVSRQMVEYLTITGADNVTRPLLAEKWVPSADLKTWTFHLRKGVKFGNGDELTADDVIYNFNRWLDPKTGSSMVGMLNSMLDESEGKDKDGKPMKIKTMTPGAVEKVDKYTVRIHLNSPDLSIPEKLYHYPAAIVHRSFGDKGANIAKTPDLGTGPYTLAEYKVGEKAILKRRGGGFKYWGEAPYLDEIHYIDTGQDAAAALAAVASDQVDTIYTLDLTLLGAAQNMPGIRVLETTTAQTGVMRIQGDKAPYDDIRVRQAMQLAADNDKMLQTAYQGRGQVAENHHVAKVQPDYAPLPIIKRDVAKAKQLLADAGHGGGLDIECNVGNTNGQWETDQVIVLKQNLAEAGINLKVNVMPASQYWEVWDKAQFSLTVWTHRPLGTMLLGVAYRTGVPWNEANYASKEFDDLLTQAESTVDMDARHKIMAKVEKRLQDDSIMIQPYFRSVMTAASNKVQNLNVHPTNYHQWHKVWIDS